METTWEFLAVVKLQTNGQDQKLLLSPAIQDPTDLKEEILGNRREGCQTNEAGILRRAHFIDHVRDRLLEV
jgi:hypothetical protein